MPRTKTPTHKVETSLLDFIENEISKLINQDRQNLIAKFYAKTLKAYSKRQFIEALEDVFSEADITGLLTQAAINKLANEFVKKRNKQVKYTKIAKRQQNIIKRQSKIDKDKALKMARVRSENILTNEQGFARDRGTLEGGAATRSQGIPTYKMWVHGMYSTPKDPRDSHVFADGQTVEIDEYFVVGGQFVQAPREFGEPAEDINCGCGVKIVIP